MPRPRMLHPENWIATGLLWAGLCFCVILAWDYLEGREITQARILMGLAIWSGGGILFGLLFRAAHRRRRDHAR